MSTDFGLSKIISSFDSNCVGDNWNFIVNVCGLESLTNNEIKKDKKRNNTKTLKRWFCLDFNFLFMVLLFILSEKINLEIIAFHFYLKLIT